MYKAALRRYYRCIFGSHRRPSSVDHAVSRQLKNQSTDLMSRPDMTYTSASVKAFRLQWVKKCQRYNGKHVQAWRPGINARNNTLLLLKLLWIWHKRRVNRRTATAISSARFLWATRSLMVEGDYISSKCEVVCNTPLEENNAAAVSILGVVVGQ